MACIAETSRIEAKGLCSRPYLVLFEQIVVEHAEKIAAEFRGDAAAKWQEAARKVRLP